MEKISLIIPCKNEVESLGAVLEEVKDNEFVNEIIKSFFYLYFK